MRGRKGGKNERKEEEEEEKEERANSHPVTHDTVRQSSCFLQLGVYNAVRLLMDGEKEPGIY